jgi:hypothetical protein
MYERIEVWNCRGAPPFDSNACGARPILLMKKIYRTYQATGSQSHRGPQRRIHECVRLPESDITAMLSVLLDHIRPEQITALLSFVHLSPTARAKGIRTR